MTAAREAGAVPERSERKRRFSAHLGYLFGELPFEQRFAAAAEAGFAFVEHPAPYAQPATQVRRFCSAEGVRFVQLALPVGDTTLGVKGLACVPGHESPFRSTLTPGFDFAEAIGCGHVHVQAGIAPPGINPQALRQTYIANLTFAAEEAATRGLTILIEAIGSETIEGYFVSNPFFAVRAIADIGKANVALLFDIFHAVNAGIDPIAFIREHAELIAHLHIADHPGRHEPGSGAIDFEALFATMDEVGYSGAIGCEYIPKGDTLAGLGWMDRYR